MERERERERERGGVHRCVNKHLLSVIPSWDLRIMFAYLYSDKGEPLRSTKPYTMSYSHSSGLVGPMLKCSVLVILTIFPTPRLRKCCAPKNENEAL